MSAPNDSEWVGCRFVMFRGAVTGRVITCGVCEWCRSLDKHDTEATQ